MRHLVKLAAAIKNAPHKEPSNSGVSKKLLYGLGAAATIGGLGYLGNKYLDYSKRRDHKGKGITSTDRDVRGKGTTSTGWDYLKNFPLSTDPFFYNKHTKTRGFVDSVSNLSPSEYALGASLGALGTLATGMATPAFQDSYHGVTPSTLGQTLKKVKWKKPGLIGATIGGLATLAAMANNSNYGLPNAYLDGGRYAVRSQDPLLGAVIGTSLGATVTPDVAEYLGKRPNMISNPTGRAAKALGAIAKSRGRNAIAMGLLGGAAGYLYSPTPKRKREKR